MFIPMNYLIRIVMRRFTIRTDALHRQVGRSHWSHRVRTIRTHHSDAQLAAHMRIVIVVVLRSGTHKRVCNNK